MVRNRRSILPFVYGRSSSTRIAWTLHQPNRKSGGHNCAHPGMDGARSEYSCPSQRTAFEGDAEAKLLHFIHPDAPLRCPSRRSVSHLSNPVHPRHKCKDLDMVCRILPSSMYSSAASSACDVSDLFDLCTRFLALFSLSCGSWPMPFADSRLNCLDSSRRQFGA